MRRSLMRSLQADERRIHVEFKRHQLTILVLLQLKTQRFKRKLGLLCIAAHQFCVD